ncbi:MAG: GtrA family protein [Bacilli bacterium]|nr:GtrA family protein [Bacilli bacterium]
MIFVTLGTQDKDFSRLLKAIDKEIEKGTIKEKVIVQAGHTKYESKNMEIFDLIPTDEFNEIIEKCDLIITHGGVGNILSAIKKNKPVIAAARLKKFKEHTNDHQKQIIGEFTKQGYILELRDFGKVGKMIEKAKTFKAKKFKSNTKNMIKLIEDYIEEDNHTSWFNKCREVLMYLLFGGLTTLVNILSFFILRKLSVGVYVSNLIAWVVAVLFAFITNKLFVFESNDKSKSGKELISFFGFRILSLGVDMGAMYLLLQVINTGEVFAKIIANVIVIILNYIFSKLFVFKK